MGQALFARYPEQVAQADEILGYSVQQLCLGDPERPLGQTQFTQPALFVVNALTYLSMVEQSGATEELLAGHSLGEYNALHAAGVFSFADGLKLVRKRGEMMSRIRNGGMAAVIGPSGERVAELLAENGLATLDLANLNSPTQTVISGLAEDLELAEGVFSAVSGCTYIRLQVSGAFHSRYMESAREQFEAFLEPFRFEPPRAVVISNVEARPYSADRVKALLSGQITHPVRWGETIQVMLGLGATDFREAGPGTILTKLVSKIRQQAQPIPIAQEAPSPPAPPAQSPSASTGSRPSSTRSRPSHWPGSEAFVRDWHLEKPCLAGGLEDGVSTPEMVIALGRSGLCGFLGIGGLAHPEARRQIDQVRTALTGGQPWGVSLPYTIGRPGWETRITGDLLELDLDYLEVVDYLQATPGLVRLRFRGMQHAGDVPRRVLARVSTLELAQRMLGPAPARVVEQLLQDGLLTGPEAELAARLPLATDVAVQADAGFAAEVGSLATVLPAVKALALQAQRTFALECPVAVGAAGAVGSPGAVAAAWMLGADFIMTGRVNQCTPEAGTSEAVKQLLAEAGVCDVAMAAEADFFELGARSQVLGKGLLFAARANKLYAIYRQSASLAELSRKDTEQLEQRYFGQDFEQVYQQLTEYWAGVNPDQLQRASADPRCRMALTFRWYLMQATRYALAGDVSRKIDFRVPCGPEMGAFNGWAAEEGLSRWQDRAVDVVNHRLFDAGAEYLRSRAEQFGQARSRPAVHSP